jgi:hypothetical protein
LFREARRRWLPNLTAELASASRAEPRRFTAVTTISPQIRSEWLAENPLAKKRAPMALVPESKVEEVKAREVVPERPIEDSKPTEQSTVGETASERQSDFTDPGELASGGTWYLDDATLSVRYRSRGHADELVRLVIDVAAVATNRHVPQHGLLPATLAEPALKTCASCHSIDTSGEHYAVNWQIEYRDTARRRFMEFSHRPHLVQPALADCTVCHQLNTRSDVMANFVGTDPMAHAHDFHPLTKSTCATCHTNSQSGGRCTLCHSYHVGAVRGD